ncbi:hypothetical protein EKN07_02130 [Actinobaculum sp. 352]|nr:hypothetical protein EKN07_02130 [Actinobaculum sp. 352]
MRNLPVPKRSPAPDAAPVLTAPPPFWSTARILRGVLSTRTAVMLCVVLFGMQVAILVMANTLSFSALLSAAVICPLVLAAMIDGVVHLLPDPLVFSAGYLAFVALLCGTAEHWFGAITTAVISLVLGAVMNRCTSLGRGDVKLIAVLALWLRSPLQLVSALGLAVLGAGLFAVALLIAQRATRTTSLALGPWLVGAAAGLWFFAGPPDFLALLEPWSH